MSKQQGYLYEVGKLYVPTRTSWPENVEYNYRDGAHELRLFYPKLTPAEIADIGKGQSRFALYVESNIIFFCFKFGDQPWSDSSYSYHLVPAGQRMLPPDPARAEERALLTVFLVSAEDGILRSIRAVTLSPLFTRSLHAAIWKQAESPWPGDTAYDRQLGLVYSRYRSQDLAKLALVTCKGGQP